MLVPAPIVAEVGYLLHRKGTPRAESAFLRSLAAGDLRTVELTSEGYSRMADLVDTYADLPLGMSDASMVALAERLGVAQVATLDRRHFRVVRPPHVDAFILLRHSRWLLSVSPGSAHLDAIRDLAAVAESVAKTCRNASILLRRGETG
jgi:uncharacterized protein